MKTSARNLVAPVPETPTRRPLVRKVRPTHYKVICVSFYLAGVAYALVDGEPLDGVLENALNALAHDNPVDDLGDEDGLIARDDTETVDRVLPVLAAMERVK